jgi:hypothetical protein
MLPVVPGLVAQFADKLLMVILGLAIVVPTIFLVVAVMFARSRDEDD